MNLIQKLEEIFTEIEIDFLVFMKNRQKYDMMTQEEIAKGLNYHRRHVKRIISSLKKKGVPIKTIRGRGGGCLIEEDYLNKLDF